ncbi:SusC/RagA family TonB-linked outer membrane protein [Pseudarcicella hirudinis]|uniref:SusC/RagA family TonB-linked outer membrane protein n=1 Tax=Pseudarcicella hirudinis TaxID=1079859 RepID=UPI0035ED3DE5
MSKNRQFNKIIFKLMRVTIFQLFMLILFTTFARAFDGKAQTLLDRKITIQFSNQEIEEALDKIEKVADVRFMYSPQLISASRRVNLNFKEERLSTILKAFLKPLNLEYEVVGNKILLNRISAFPTQNTIKEQEKNIPNIEVAEQTVSGIVTDEKGETLPGVNILVKGTQKGVTTDAKGQFKISVADGNAVLVFTSVGYKKQEVTIGGKTQLNISLQLDTQSLEEVVVVGYGTQKKKDLTGSVSSVPVKDIDKVPVSRADQMIQGRVSGVQVIQTNAAPGGNVSIRIRGTNSINSGNEPLFVVDGFPGAGDLNTINPSDIESIEILKDASSTAIYGSRGANGVVLITTKKGKAGKQIINFEAYTGIQQVAKKYDMMNAREFATHLDSVTAQNNRANGTKTPLNYTPAQIAAMGEGTNWQDQVLRVARISNYQFSISGGTNDTKYNFSAGYFNQEGIVINSGFERGTLRFNFDKTISPRLKMGYTSQLAYSSQNDALVNTVGGSAGGTVYDALRFNPVMPVRDSTGAYTYKNDDPNHFVDVAGNPVAYAENVTDHRTNLRTLLTGFGEYEIIDGLKLRMSIGTDINYSTRDYFTPSYLYITTQNTSSGSSQKTSNTNFSWVNENTLTYDRQFDKNNFLNAVAGASVQVFKQNNFTAAANNFFTNQLGTDNLGIAGTTLPNNTSSQKNTLASFFGRVNYQFMNKYLFTVTMRADGSSRFGDGNKWGYFLQEPLPGV